ncbi:hypothetical protein SAMN05216223_12997 [Actinacidiphila yanglinensis]|uniref:Uncharacterized protein n=1 Tax=Actinacidiphila yanglinensis TaxID=310779 RepID=A0A1H6EBF0_9ACTN|nr:hypothetical protein SAMN05216223_12997 [Actinacidiphila yanglinensis]
MCEVRDPAAIRRGGDELRSTRSGVRSACFTQFRNVSAEPMPSFGATAFSAAD